MVAMLSATNATTSVSAIRRLRSPMSVAKYQPKRISRPRPTKNVRIGLMFLSCRAKSRHLSLLRRFWPEHVCDGGFFHFDLHVIGHFHHHRGLLHVDDQPVDAGIRHDAIARFQARDQCFLFSLSLFLWC